MSGSWLERVQARQPLKPADVADALRDLVAAHDSVREAFRALEEHVGSVDSDIAGLTARVEALEAKPEPEKPTRRSRASDD